MANQKTTFVEETKELLSDPTKTIKLDDLVSTHIKQFLIATNLEHFPIQGSNVQKEDFVNRLQKYQEALKDLQIIVVLIARWGNKEHLLTLEKIFARLAETERGSSGLRLWVNLSWYPIQVLMYSAGISAIDSHKYDVLKLVLETQVQIDAEQGKLVPLIVPVATNLSGADEMFKWLPGQERKHTPRSEYLFQFLQPVLNEILFLGKSYEEIFDEFEIYSAFVFFGTAKHHWSPVGRFSWKYQRSPEENPINRMIEQAKKAKEKWDPIRVDLFGGSFEDFIKLANEFKEYLSKLQWW